MAASKKALLLHDWTTQIASNMSTFQSGAQLLVRGHQKSNVKSTSFALMLKDMAQHEYSQSIKESLEESVHWQSIDGH